MRQLLWPEDYSVVQFACSPGSSRRDQDGSLHHIHHSFASSSQTHSGLSFCQRASVTVSGPEVGASSSAFLIPFLSLSGLQRF